MGLLSKNAISEEKATIVRNAIQSAELNTSGEVRVHVDFKCKGDVIEHAIAVFHNLEMHKTAARNGVLIYVAVDDHVFAIIGDEGINKVVPDNFWNDVKDGMAALFKQNKLVEGICYGVEKSGEKLKEFFPYQRDDKNELSDDISFG